METALDPADGETVVTAGAADGPWGEILELARWTPSPHNTQPWKVRHLGKRRIEVLLDPARALPDEDISGCFILAALAMYVEALRILAANRGFGLATHDVEAEAVRRAATRAGGLADPIDGSSTEHSTAGDPAGLVRYATVELTDGPIVEPRFEDAVFLSRRTSRLAPAEEPLPPEAPAALEALATPLGYTLHLIEDRETVADLMRLNLDAVTEDLTTPAYRDEISRWFRYGREHERETRDGLSARCMNMPPRELRMLPKFAGLASWRGVGGIFRALYRRRLGPVPRLMILDGPFWNADAAVKGGTSLMRLWLGLERHGLRIHPFGNLITNHDANLALRARTGIRDPWIVFRAGRTPEPPRSERLALEEVLVG